MTTRAAWVAALLLLGATEGAYAADRAPHGPGAPRCRLRPPPDPPAPDDLIGYPYDVSDVRGGAECEFVVDRAVSFRVQLDADARANQFTHIEIFQSDGAWLQTIPLGRGHAPPPQGATYLRADDIDFDGHADIGVLVDYRPPGNSVFRYWRFDPATGRFVDHPGTDDLTNPSVDVAGRTIVTYEDDGGAGMLYRRAWHRWRGDRLEIVREEAQTWVDGHYERTTKEGEPGTLAVTRVEAVPEVRNGRLYDARQWEAVKLMTVRFGSDPGPMQVVLLRSRELTGASGVGGPLHDVNLVIGRGEELLYAWKPDPPRFDYRGSHRRFFMRADLDVEDVTADGVPEVIFRSGDVGASDWADQQHVVHYDARLRAFRDVRDADFEDGGLEQLRWLEVDGRRLAVHASAIWDKGEAHYEPHVYEYRAYCWNDADGAFVKVHSSRSAERFDDRGPPDSEYTAVLREVTDAVRATCVPKQPDAASPP